MKKIIRGGSGLGDSLYVVPVAQHYVRAGHEVIVKSDYPELFADVAAAVEPFTRTGTNVLAHYTGRKARTETNQWQDICIAAGVGELPLRIDWTVKNNALVEDIRSRACGRTIVLINGGRPPMGRTDGFGKEMLPQRETFEAVLGALDDCFLVEIGRGPELYPLPSHLDLSEKTSAGDLLDLASIAGAMVGQCSFMIPLAEAFDKPLMVVWAAAGLVSATQFVQLCTPVKILSKPSSRYVMDDWSDAQVAEAMDGFRQLFQGH